MGLKNTLKTFVLSLVFLSLNCVSYNNCIGFEDVKDSFINITHEHNKIVLPYDSFVKLEKKFFDKDKNYLFSTFASGTIVKHYRNSTAILTAQHFCDDSEEKAEAPKEILPIISINGVWDKNQVVHFGVNQVMDSKFDLCIIYTDSVIQQEGVVLSPVAPQRGEKVFNLSGPLGLSNGETILAFEGYYAGSLANNGSEFTSLYTLPITHGSSGSAVLNEHSEVIGVVYGVMKDFNHVALVVPYKEVKRFLKENKILD